MQWLVTDEEFAAEDERLQVEYNQRMTQHLALTTKLAKNAKKSKPKSTQPPRMGRRKLMQKFICPCYLLAGKKCPDCNGTAVKIQDPNGPSGAMISSCHTCQCPCGLGPFENTDREGLFRAFQDYEKEKVERPIVSEGRGTGFGEAREMAELAMQVRMIFRFTMFFYS